MAAGPSCSSSTTKPGMRNFLEKTLAPRAAARCTAPPTPKPADELVRGHRFDLRHPRHHAARQERHRLAARTARAGLRRRGGADHRLRRPRHRHRGAARRRERLHPQAVPRDADPQRRAAAAWSARGCSARTGCCGARCRSARRPADGLVGRSIAIKGLQAALQRVAAVDSTVLLTGESGTGKELAALALHRNSPRAAGPFVPVNCATMSPELIETELFGHAQRRGAGAARAATACSSTRRAARCSSTRSASCRCRCRPRCCACWKTGASARWAASSEIPVDVRIVAATNRPLADEVAAGRFRADLYYRLQVVEINLPPLRAHKEDIPDLVGALHRHARAAARRGADRGQRRGDGLPARSTTGPATCASCAT